MQVLLHWPRPMWQRDHLGRSLPVPTLPHTNPPALFPPLCMYCFVSPSSSGGIHTIYTTGCLSSPPPPGHPPPTHCHYLLAGAPALAQAQIVADHLNHRLQQLHIAYTAAQGAPTDPSPSSATNHTGVDVRKPAQLLQSFEVTVA